MLSEGNSIINFEKFMPNSVLQESTTM